jgi:type II secretion system protein G
MKQKGFSLIELLVVITIIGILAAIGLTSYRTANQKARDSRRQADIQQTRSALEMWRTDCGGTYPNVSTWTQLMGSNSCDGVNRNFAETYLGGAVLVDPSNGAYSYERLTPTTYEITYWSEVDNENKAVRNP